MRPGGTGDNKRQEKIASGRLTDIIAEITVEKPYPMNSTAPNPVSSD